MGVVNISANQLWKKQVREGKTTLDFLPWLEREKTKAFFNTTGEVAIPVNDSLNSGIQQAFNDVQAQAGLKTNVGKEYFMGIRTKYLWWAGGILGATGLTFATIFIIKKIRKK